MTDEKPRRLPRFSLRSLILFVTLAGSGYGLWAKWEPWAPGPVLKGHSRGVNTATFSPDGKRIVTASEDTTVRVWNAMDGRPLAILKAHSGSVLNTAYSADGRHIVSTSADKTARIWSRRRPECWWGVAWLPEFWLTLVLGIGLVWSVWRDHRSLEKMAASQRAD